MIGPWAIVRGAATVAVEVASALRQLVDVWSFPGSVDALWADTATYKQRHGCEQCHATMPIKGWRCVKPDGHDGRHGYAGMFWDNPTSSPAPPSRSGMPGDRPEAAASTGSAQEPGSLGAPPLLRAYDLIQAAQSCRYHGNNTYPETKRDNCFYLAERLEAVAAVLKTLEDAR